MNFYICGANVFLGRGFEKKNLLVKDGLIADIFSGSPSENGAFVFQLNNCFVFPGLIDVHVHLREPGFFYKESIKTGTLAAARGGFTSVCSMPNLDPVPDCGENLKAQTDIIERDALVKVYPYGSITAGQRQLELSKMEELAEKAIGFSDDGVGVVSGEIMRSAMLTAKSLGKMIVAHCEDTAFGTASESEWRQLERDLKLVEETGCSYHVCHVSTKESVALIRKAKSRGLPVSCETAPHYLLLCDEDVKDEGRFKMNPPIRQAKDRVALIEGIKDGTIEIIATDHAPHSAEEKSRGFAGSLNGIVGLEIAFPALYTGLVKTGIISLERLIELMQVNPAKRFGIDGGIEPNAKADLTVFDLENEFVVDPEAFLSKGSATPFAGQRVFGKCLLTVVDGKTAYTDKDLSIRGEAKKG